MQNLTQQDLHFVVRRLPRDIRDLLRTMPLFVGGGFIRETIAGGEVRDIDLFGSTKEDLEAAAQLIARGREVNVHRTANALTVLCPPRLPVQFITRWTFAEPSLLVSSFDFTCCQAAIWFDRRVGQYMSMCGTAFYPDLAARRLVYTFPVREEEAGGSMMRVRKFLQRGYTIQADSLGGVISRLVNKVDENRLHGEGIEREQSRARVLAGLLHEVDPLLVVDGLEPIDEHAAI